MLIYEFWPHWDSTGTENTNYTEPDLFIRFEAFDLIIEAKRDDYKGQQIKDQWKKHIRSYYNTYEASARKPLFYVALSGLQCGWEKQGPEEIESGSLVYITTCRWHRILKLVQKAEEKLNQSKEVISSVNAVHNILSDLILAFSIHGFSTGKLLHTMPVNYSINHTSLGNLPNLKVPFRWKPIPSSLRNINLHYL
ncbi:hypothetical protein OCK74_14875 [Chitinophagaceae bacterium LB-8]|uniref:Uncharacterized protein n=1 Tax=Paraflavisolibacter caeni TaxID=2982496 RepID=A0A9X3BHY7_9BACT|nr:hypothetical protein [Paraflavisolibacter caeni]MCU7550402.1 hypothetical protein [Paraflavisolibacter caeni]